VNPLLAVVGPTASGKTRLAIEVAETLGAEIISADSMQVYRGMEIGVGTPMSEELTRVKHHFVGMLDPGDHFSAGEFQRLARRVIDDLTVQGKPAVIVGGSGLYVRALIDGLFEGPGADEFIRSRLHSEAEERGVAALYGRLEQQDPQYAAEIQPGDLRRIVRALEVLEMTGRPFSDHHSDHRQTGESLPAIQVALDYPREQLYARIDARVDQMIDRGLVDEVRRLVEAGYESRLLRLRSLGYPEFVAHLKGELTVDEAKDAMKLNTRRFAKRQLSWFRSDTRIHWLSTMADIPPEAHAPVVLSLLNAG
jgi:tRNA dimethylallyltransferase